MLNGKVDEKSKQWNEAIKRFFENQYQGLFISAGNPGKLLQKIGLPNLDIQIPTDVLDTHKEKHDLDYDDVKNLPKLINAPLAAFIYSANERYNSNQGLNIVVNKKNEDRILMIGLQFKKIDEKVISLYVNSIRTIHYRDVSNLLNWLKEKKLVYWDLKKIAALQAGESISPVTYKTAIEHKYKAEIKKNQIFVPENIEKVKKIFSSGTLSGLGNVPMYPTYTPLQDYGHLIDHSLGKIEFIKRGNVADTVRSIKNVIAKYHPQVKHLALYLRDKHGDRTQTAFNIWHWCRTNINYGYDTPGHEELRTPARTFADRHHGVDCDDFTILVSSLLLNIGIKPQLTVVAFNGSDAWSHIFAGIGNHIVNHKPQGGLIVDPVDTQFNRVLSNITKTYIMDLNSIEVLSGIPTDETITVKHLGYGCNRMPNAYSEKIMASMQNRLPDFSSRHGRKAGFMLAHNQSIHQMPLMLVSDHIYDVNRDGTIVWKNKEIGQIAEDFLDEADGIIQGIIDGSDSDFSDTERFALFGLGEFLPEEVSLDGLGFSLKAAWNKAKKKIKKAYHKAKDKIKKVAKTVKKAGGKVWQGTKKVALSAPRVAFLGLIRLNAFGLATRFYLGYMSYSEAKKHGIPIDLWKKAVAATKTTEKFWVKLGGNASAFRNTVLKGRKMKPILNKQMKMLYGAGLRGLGSLGSASVSAMLASAGAILAKVWKWLKTVPWDKVLDAAKKVKGMLPHHHKNQSDSKKQGENNDELPDFTTAYTTGGKLKSEKSNDSSSGGSSWLIPAAAAAAALFFLI